MNNHKLYKRIFSQFMKSVLGNVLDFKENKNHLKTYQKDTNNKLKLYFNDNSILWERIIHKFNGKDYDVLVEKLLYKLVINGDKIEKAVLEKKTVAIKGS